ncbi:MAG: Flp pilus assembly complex ATPase component TadA [Bacteriovorax sp.]|nr:Flp pilus assembly complex ATPase component TadA [Bacteriovorax sp.]
MFRKEFVEVITKTGMVPIKDLRPLVIDKDTLVISELGLLQFKFFDDIRFAKQLAENYNLTYIDLSKAKIPERIFKIVKKSDIIKYRVIPIQKNAKAVSIAIYDPSLIKLQAELQSLFQYPIEFILTSLSSWADMFARVPESIEDVLETIREIKSDSKKEENINEEDIGDDVIRYVNRILAEAFVTKCSDIHIEPYENNFRIRYRQDGSLVEAAKPPRSLMLPIISRVKILAQMDISEKRKPQDGRIKLEIGGKPIDYRVSSLPTLFGEKIVLRLLDSSNLQLDMTKLGFEQKQLEVFKEGIYRPYGMCLVTGPTGSGKTTTLYSAIAELNTIDTNISTAEDPVEFNLEGINQVNVKKDIGLTFAACLKSFLRQDPDIIMVGEIRDGEVGEIAIEAALTGHLVLSTLHTNDAPSTITRLINMGIEPFLVAAAVNVIVAQRLCRRICKDCKEIDAGATQEILVACGISPTSAAKITVYKGKGCQNCNNTGYKGRVAIYEVLEMSPMIKEILLRHGSTDEIKRQGIKEGMKTLRMCALTKVAQGLTTVDEAVSNSASDKM